MRNIILMVSLLSLVSCSSTAKKEIAELADITNTLNVKPLWVTPAGKASPDQHNQLPVTIVGNKIFIANANGSINTLDLTNGELIWEKELGEVILSGPGYGEDIVVVTTEEGEVIALDATNGDILWRQQVSSETLVNPLINDGRVYVQTIDGKLTTLDIKDGKNIWTQSQPVPALTLRGTSEPVLVDENIVAGFDSGKLIAFNATSGKTVWETTVAVPKGRTDLERIVDIDGIFQRYDGIIYVVSYQGRIAALSANDGQIIWARDMSSYTGVSVEDDQIYITDEEGYVWALDRKTGATLWRQDKLLGRNVSIPVIMQDAVVVSDYLGYVHWLSKSDGEFLARQNLADIYRYAYFDISEETIQDSNLAVTTAPKAKDNKLVVRDNEGSIAVLQVLPQSK